MEQYNRVVGLWQSYKIAAADLDKCLDSFRVLFAFHSGKIENEEINYHDTRGIFAYLHARFEFIHPFADGSGRVGRTLRNYYPVYAYAKAQDVFYAGNARRHESKGIL